MPEGLLTGFHGKLPGAGDFVSRGLPTGFAAFWDRWATRHLAPRRGDWPAGGLRLVLVSGGRSAVGVVVPSEDRVGRRFPLAGFAIASHLPPSDALDRWCNAAFAVLTEAAGEAASPDVLLDRLEALPTPEGQGVAPQPMTLWLAGQPPLACDPDQPQAVLDRLFSCS